MKQATAIKYFYSIFLNKFSGCVRTWLVSYNEVNIIALSGRFRIFLLLQMSWCCVTFFETTYQEF